VCGFTASVLGENPTAALDIPRYVEPVYSLVRRFVKTAVGFLALGLAIGGWMIARRELAGAAPNPYLVSAHTHALFVGFVMMLIMGVALWLFPRPAKEDERYSPLLASASYWVTTVGTAARVGGELARAGMIVRGAPFWLRLGIVLAAIAQGVGIGMFFYTMWSRIRPVGSQAREARGERF